MVSKEPRGDSMTATVPSDAVSTMAVSTMTEGADPPAHVAIFQPHGSLDAETASRFREEAAAYIGADRVLIDLAEVPFVDSYGLGALVGVIRRVRERGGHSVVYTPVRSVARLLEVVGLDRLVPIHDSLPAARADLGLTAHP
jgi:anti-sigma B factor antagonist